MVTGTVPLGGSISILAVYADAEEESFLAMIQPWADENGVEIEYTATRDINAQLTTQIAGGNPPDIAGLPGSGRDGPVRARRRPRPAGRRHRHGHIREPVRRGLDHGRYGRRPAGRHLHEGQRQGPDLLQPGAVRGRRLHGPRGLRRPDRPRRPDLRRTAPPRGASASRAARPAAGRQRTGSRTSSCASPDPTSTTSGSRASSRGRAPRSRAAFEAFGAWATRRGIRRRRVEPGDQHQLRQRRRLPLQ